MINTLTEEEKKDLKSQHRNQRDGKIRDRIKAVLLHDQGYTLQRIAEILLLSHEGVRKHIYDYHSSKKLSLEHSGSASKLSEKELKLLEKHLEENNYVTARDIRQYIIKTFEKVYTIAGVTKLLKKLGFIYKKPKLVPGKFDAAAQEEFKEEYNALKKSLNADEDIYFMDSVHPQYQAQARYGWIKKGKCKTLPTNSGWKRMHIIGAINVKNLDLVQTYNPKVNAECIIDFLQELERNNANKSKIYLICDNAGYHKSKKVKEYLKTSKIELIFLPAYSPNLNPIERLWKFMHSKTTCNRYYENFDKFTEKIKSFFKNITDYSKQLRSLITDNFQTIKIDHFFNSSS